MTDFYIVAQGCEYTGNPVTSTIQVFTDIKQAEKALIVMEEEDPGQYSQLFARNRETGRFECVADVEDGEVKLFVK